MLRDDPNAERAWNIVEHACQRGIKLEEVRIGDVTIRPTLPPSVDYRSTAEILAAQATGAAVLAMQAAQQPAYEDGHADSPYADPLAEGSDIRPLRPLVLEIPPGYISVVEADQRLARFGGDLREALGPYGASVDGSVASALKCIRDLVEISDIVGIRDLNAPKKRDEICHIRVADVDDGAMLCGARPTVAVHGGRAVATCVRCLQLAGRCRVCGIYHDDLEIHRLHDEGQLAKLGDERDSARRQLEVMRTILERNRESGGLVTDEGQRELAEPLRAFTDEMYRKLRENDHKGGWDDDLIEELARRLMEEVGELLDELGLSAHSRRDLKKLALDFDRGRTIDPVAVCYEAADIGNFAMMIHDRHRHLSKPSPASDDVPDVYCAACLVPWDAHGDPEVACDASPPGAAPPFAPEDDPPLIPYGAVCTRVVRRWADDPAGDQRQIRRPCGGRIVNGRCTSCGWRFHDAAPPAEASAPLPHRRSCDGRVCNGPMFGGICASCGWRVP